jgi:hypothetical protein
MRTSKSAAGCFAVVIGCLLFNNVAMGQGCGMAVNSSTISCCGNSNHPNSDCSSPWGDPNNFCYLSYGNCCDVDYSLANTRFSDKCLLLSKTFGSGPAGASYRPRILLAGSCSGRQLTAVQSLVPVEPEASHIAFVIRDRLNLEAIQ